MYFYRIGSIYSMGSKLLSTRLILFSSSPSQFSPKLPKLPTFTFSPKENLPTCFAKTFRFDISEAIFDPDMILFYFVITDDHGEAEAAELCCVVHLAVALQSLTLVIKQRVAHAPLSWLHCRWPGLDLINYNLAKKCDLNKWP